MGRIRTIKPEFPQSETIGRLSRDARLLFIQLWTVADDEGRGRGASRMLASTLYPYDEDAQTLIDKWLGELINEGCIEIYKAEGTSYFQICKWSHHQKIDRPTPSRLPAPDGSAQARRSERDIELVLFDRMKSAESIFGRSPIIDVSRQVRVGSSYLDIVVKTPNETIVLEIKRDRLTDADRDQVLRYCVAVNGIPVLIGTGLSPKFSTANGVALMSVSESGKLSFLLASELVNDCSITLDNARERQPLDLGPRTMDLGPVPRTTEAYASADVVGENDKAKLFRIGKTILVSFGVKEQRTGALIGQWLKAKNDPVGLLAAIQYARDQNIAEPVAYISALLQDEKPKGQKGRGKPNLSELAFELADEIRDRESQAGIIPADDTFGSG